MNVVKKSEAIRSGLQKGFRDGTSKLSHRKCFGYDIGPDGDLIINPGEAAIVRWIFDQYLDGSSLRTIAADLERKDVLSPTGRPRWNRETLNKLLSNEKYTGRVLLQKTVSVGGSQIKNDGFVDYKMRKSAGGRSFGENSNWLHKKHPAIRWKTDSRAERGKARGNAGQRTSSPI